MGGAKVETQGMFSYISPEQRVPQDHPLRAIRVIVDRSLAEMDSHFSTMYSTYGRPSIPPEYLLRVLLVQALYSVRSERQLIEQINYNPLFPCFAGIGIDDAIWVPTVFTMNRKRLLGHVTVQRFFCSALEQTRRQNLLSEEFFVDGTLPEAWASQKSFQPKDPEPRQVDGSRFRSKTHSDETHVSVTDPGASLTKNAPDEASRLTYLGHLLVENRHGLIARQQVTSADKGYARLGFARELCDRNVTRHTASKRIGFAIDGRSTRHTGYALSIHVRGRIESIFCWMNTVGRMHKRRLCC